MAPTQHANLDLLLEHWAGRHSVVCGMINDQLQVKELILIDIFFSCFRRLVANSDNALRNPALIFENVAPVKRFVDSREYAGPVAVAGVQKSVRD